MNPAQVPGSTPRVGAAQLGSFTGKKVSFVGKVQELNQGATMFESPDGSMVQVQSNDPASFQVGGVYEVIGSVNPDCSIFMEQRIEYSDRFGKSEFMFSSTLF